MPGDRSLRLQLSDVAERLDPDTPIRLKHLRTVIRAVSEAIGEHVEDRVIALIRRIEALENAVPAYRGTGACQGSCRSVSVMSD
jgi:hypothetical protein